MENPEEEPFKHKYEAREILQKLAKDPMIDLKSNLDDPSFLVTLSNAIVYYKIGKNYFDCEENSSARDYLKLSLVLFNQHSDLVKDRYLNAIQDVQIILGIIECQYEKYDEGMPYLAEAEQIYIKGREMGGVEKVQINNIQRHFLAGTSTYKQLKDATDVFRFYIDGGLDKVLLERNHTQTLFYLAQIYTQKGDKEKAITYCCDTM